LGHETDFLDLYRILGVKPDCELVEFKQAYRRRVLVLHPDRRARDGNDIIAGERLQRLTALYGAAMRFHRQHGRLPGAHHQHRPADAPATRAGTTSISSRPKRGEGLTRRSRWLWLMAAAAGTGWVLWSGRPMPSSLPAAPSEPASVSHPNTPVASVLPQRLRLGMDSDTVRAIEGAPIMVNGDRWDYGPSWIRFENGKVVDWYSSELQPLKASRSPTAPVQP
jgi:hypothetical protein